ncbi:DUF429 domain-containing protein [uncultured Sunxiuqinia sp.]|uniref:DUF429 domain-containing protein n=1 Tax=uncultured Sunxiuqinia sp. TaxID=1573825 RepID=UPI002AA6CBDC|nr:DUF429 domain-containing protein [uncultured Sunxiuqinia sp.]
MLGKQEYKVLGIDGCKTGWCVAILDGMNYSIEIHSRLNQILYQHSNAICCLIDMPIGLPKNGEERNLESIARKELLPGFSSTIFTPPCYEVLSATNYEQAKLINQQITGKSLSIQSWNLVPKIRELDEFLEQNTTWKTKTKESHPEINFKNLNNGKLLKHKKAAKEHVGIQERLAILSKQHQALPDFFNQYRNIFKKSHVKDDDLVDALCLCLTAQIGIDKGFQLIGEQGPSTANNSKKAIATIKSL